MKKRALLVAMLLATQVVSGCSSIVGGTYSNPTVETSKDALKLLKEGNQRFVDEEMENYDLGDTKRTELSEGQKPFAVVVTCSDSRVAPEYIYDQGLGDIFVVRVAGNVLDTDEIASVEYAVEHLGCKLVVVMGHESCGAVTAAVESVKTPTEEVEEKNANIVSLLEKIQPAVTEAIGENLGEEETIDKAIDLNVELGVSTLEKSSTIMKEGIESGDVQVVGSKYILESGEVSWFE